LGRRDSLIANRTLANQNLPSPFSTLAELKEAFRRQGLDTTDLVALSGNNKCSMCSTMLAIIINGKTLQNFLYVVEFQVLIHLAELTVFSFLGDCTTSVALGDPIQLLTLLIYNNCAKYALKVDLTIW